MRVPPLRRQCESVATATSAPHWPSARLPATVCSVTPSPEYALTSFTLSPKLHPYQNTCHQNTLTRIHTHLIPRSAVHTHLIPRSAVHTHLIPRSGDARQRRKSGGRPHCSKATALAVSSRMQARPNSITRRVICCRAGELVLVSTGCIQ